MNDRLKRLKEKDKFYYVIDKRDSWLRNHLSEMSEETGYLTLFTNSDMAIKKVAELKGWNYILTITLADYQIPEYIDNDFVKIPIVYLADIKCDVDPEFRVFEQDEEEVEPEYTPSRMRNKLDLCKDNVVDKIPICDEEEKENVEPKPAVIIEEVKDFSIQISKKTYKVNKEKNKNVIIQTKITEKDNFVLQNLIKRFDLSTSEFLRRVIVALNDSFIKDENKKIFKIELD